MKSATTAADRVLGPAEDGTAGEGRDLVVSATGRAELQSIARSQRLPAALALRAQMILRIMEGESNSEVARRFGVSRPTVTLWRARYRARGIAGLQNESRPGRPRSTREEQIAGLIDTALASKPQGKTRWSGRGLAAQAGLSKTTAHRYLSMLSLQPHRGQRACADAFCIDGACAVAGLYLNPPEHALVVCVDPNGEPRRMPRAHALLGACGVERESGAAALLASLDRADANVLLRCRARGRQREFLSFLRAIDLSLPARLQARLICGPEQVEGPSGVRSWLARHPRFHLRYMPTYAAWLSEVQRGFASVGLQSIGPGFFDAVAAVKHAIGRFVDHYEQHPRAFSWIAPLVRLPEAAPSPESASLPHTAGVLPGEAICPPDGAAAAANGASAGGAAAAAAANGASAGGAAAAANGAAAPVDRGRKSK